MESVLACMFTYAPFPSPPFSSVMLKLENHVPSPDMMESVLQEIGIGYVSGKFKEKKVDIGVAMSAKDKDFIKIVVRTIEQRVRLRDIGRRRYYDIANNSTHDCGSYSYTITTRPSTTSSMQTVEIKERSFLFSPRSSGNNGHLSSSSRRASSSTTARPNAEKKARCSNLERPIHVPI